ncbi:MAG: histidine kinase [bacterium]
MRHRSAKLCVVSLCCYFLSLNQAFAFDARQDVDSTNAIPYESIVSHLRKSIALFSANVEKARSIHYQAGEAKALTNLGIAYYLSGKHDKSTECNLQAITIFEALNAVEELTDIYGAFGYQLKRRDLHKANHYMRLAIKIASKHGFTSKAATLYDNYGVLKEMESQLDSAMYFYQRALTLKRELSDSVGIPFSLNHIAGVHAMKGEFNKAQQYARLSDEYRNREQGDYGRAQNLVLYAEIYADQGKVDLAIEKYNQCLRLARRLGDSGLIRYCYEQLTNLYEQKQDYARALASHKNYVSFKDSVLNVETNARIAELEIDYETEKKDRLLAENELEIRRRTNLLFIAGTLIVLILLASIWIYRIQKLKRERVRQDLEWKNQLQRSESEKKMADEKLRISRELHDNIGSQLTFLISSLDNLTYAEKDNPSVGKLERLSAFGRNTLDELRNTIWAMKHEDADLSRLTLKLNELKQQVNSGVAGLQMEVENRVTADVPLNATQMLNLYRIVQEAVHNTIKHAGATLLEITFEDTETGFAIRIHDNGSGFVVGEPQAGHGLNNMKQRCEEIGGVFQVDSSAEGTTILCSLGEKSI